MVLRIKPTTLQRDYLRNYLLNEYPRNSEKGKKLEVYTRELLDGHMGHLQDYIDLAVEVTMRHLERNRLSLMFTEN